MQLANIFGVLLCVVGLIGNFLVIVCSLIWRELRKSTSSWYIFQMAVADAVYLLSMPFNVAEKEYGMWIFADWFCPVKNSLLYLNIYASVLFLSILSIDRYIAVCKPFSERLQTLRSSRATYIMTLAVWAVALCCCIPVMRNSYVFQIFDVCIFQFPSDNVGTFPEIIDLYRNSDNSSYIIYEYNDTEYAESNYYYLSNESHEGSLDCTYQNQPAALKRMVVFNFVVMYAGPLIAMSVGYGLIIYHLTCNAPKSSKHGSRVRNRRVTVMCAVLVTCFAVLCLPFQVIHVGRLKGFSIESHHCMTWHKVGAMLIVLNSALNPYLYTFLCNKFRRKFRRLLLHPLQQTPSGSRRTSKSSGGSANSVTKMSRIRRKSHTPSSRSKESASAPLDGVKVVEEGKMPSPPKDEKE